MEYDFELLRELKTVAPRPSLPRGLWHSQSEGALRLGSDPFRYHWERGDWLIEEYGAYQHVGAQPSRRREEKDARPRRPRRHREEYGCPLRDRLVSIRAQVSWIAPRNRTYRLLPRQHVAQPAEHGCILSGRVEIGAEGGIIWLN